VNYPVGMNRLDHIVVAAATLGQGVEYLRDLLGVEVPAGGVHATMGTHNRVMQLGGDAYLEIIAINPDGTVPPRPRWFGLDAALLRAALAERPRLVTWVMNTPNLAALAASADFAVGTPAAFSRDDLSWDIALTDDGRLLADGLLPYCIQWHNSPHPSRKMADLGCRLQKLILHHNRPDWLAARLESLDATQLVEIDPLTDSESPRLTAVIDTPRGAVNLE